jgi:hypothetical protein
MISEETRSKIAAKVSKIAAKVSKIAAKVSKTSRQMWDSRPDLKEQFAERMKKRHADGLMDEAKRKAIASRKTPESRKKTSDDNRRRYKNKEIREQMALSCGGRPFLVFKGDEFIGRFVSQADAYRELNIPNNGHISTRLRTGKGTLYGYRFIYESETDLINIHQKEDIFIGGKDEN